MINYSTLRYGFEKKEHNLDTDDLAYFTHYLHNSNSGASKMYENKAHEIYSNSCSLNETCWQDILPINWDVPFPSPEKEDFTFIDLFAGIGGFRIPLQELGGKCVFSSEFDTNAQKAYESNFAEIPFGDITQIDKDIIPQHDILCAGFPCQPFSISGKMRGFNDTRGTLIHHVFAIIKKCNPKVIFLENVKHLVYHDKKRTLAVIIKKLEELGYKVTKQVLNASDFGLPQNRERIIIIGHKNKAFDFSKLNKIQRPNLIDFLDKNKKFEYLDEPYTLIDKPKTQESGLVFAGYRNKTIRKAGVRPGTEHLSRVHKQPNRIYSTKGVHPALPSQEISGRFWILHRGKVRKLTIEECYRIMGFPEKFILTGSKSELYRRIGNSVAIPMIREVGKQIKKQLLEII